VDYIADFGSYSLLYRPENGREIIMYPFITFITVILIGGFILSMLVAAYEYSHWRHWVLNERGVHIGWKEIDGSFTPVDYSFQDKPIYRRNRRPYDNDEWRDAPG